MRSLLARAHQNIERSFAYVGNTMQPHRDTLLMVGDGAALLVGWFYAHQIAHPGTSLRLWVLPTIVFVCIGVGYALGTYRNRWSVASFAEAIHLAGAYGAALLLVSLIARLVDRSTGSAVLAITEATLLGGAIVSGVVRTIWRLGWEQHLAPDSSAAPIIIAGSGRVAEQAARAMLLDRHSPYRPVAFIDDNRHRENREVMGVPVLGTFDSLAETAAKLGVVHVLIAIQDEATDAATVTMITDRIAGLARDAKLDVLGVPSVRELYGDDVRVSDIKPLKEVDLLNRREVTTDMAAIGAYLTGKRVLVTGAGGSIGSELCRQITNFHPEALVMLDRDESGLHATQLSIEGHALLSDPNLVVADIRDAARLAEVFEAHEPEIVFHAAALKHLPLLEMHPSEAWKSNVIGSLNVLEAAKNSGVSCFVNVSTDKAADPCSILGYSKRVAERLTAAFAETDSGRYLSVRFGNVLGSRGSMLETFRGQMQKGEPLTVTHPDITRYFMTVEEAVLLLIQAGAIGRTGEVLILDMGEPVKIADVARRMASLVDPPAEIRFVGLRPNEKMHEDLFGPGEVDVRPIHPLISHVPVRPLSLKALQRVVSNTNGLNHRDTLVDLIEADSGTTTQADAR
jgi:FlaA1/EpsC-like NDP-sugar epimerase